jgi:putative CocE/NonD family hydrolase
MRDKRINRGRLVGLRFTPEEYLLLHDKYKAITCRQLSEYIRRILFEKKITVFTRNQSMDDFMTELIVLRKESGNQLSFTKPAFNSAPDEYVSDPAKPVPYTEGIHNDQTREYMIDDQRFTTNRTDVLVYKTDTLTEDITLAGPLVALLKTGISTSDADFVVKLIDVFPDNFEYAATAGDQQPGYVMNGYQMLVRGDIMRGRYRNSFEKPEAFIPGKISEVRFTLNDIAHTFKKGHRIMVHIQSSWFPLVDRNPQRIVDIYSCSDKDFQKATIKIYHDTDNASLLVLPVLHNSGLSLSQTAGARESNGTAKND